MEEHQIKKPKGRIVVLIYQSYGALMVCSGLINELLILFNLVSNSMLSQPQLEQIKAASLIRVLAASLIWVLLGLYEILIRLFGAILLFMLRKVGFYLLVADAAIQSIFLLIGILKGFNAGGMEGAVIVWGIAIAIAIYSWRLCSKGLLK